MPILKFGNPVLRLPSSTVGDREKNINALVKNMTETMYGAPGIGLAAVQIGVLKKVITYDVGDGLQVLMNPEITEYIGEEVLDEEGCLSVPEIRLPVKRHEKVKVSGIDLSGKKVEVEAEGLLSRALQHEVDHTNGILILDRTTREEKRKALKQLNEITGIT